MFLFHQGDKPQPQAKASFEVSGSLGSMPYSVGF